jgi:amidophosphoribosyltransferase
MKDFVAFRAALALLQERGLDTVIDQTYERCVAALQTKEADQVNLVKAIYERFTDQEISAKIAEIVRPKGISAEVSVLFQTVSDLNQACPLNSGDWYFTGNYPTPGGFRVVNKAFVNFMEGKGQRAY